MLACVCFFFSYFQMKAYGYKLLISMQYHNYAFNFSNKPNPSVENGDILEHKRTCTKRIQL